MKFMKALTSLCIYLRHKLSPLDNQDSGYIQVYIQCMDHQTVQVDKHRQLPGCAPDTLH